MTQVVFVVPGEPRSKARHRTGVRGGKIIHYKDEQTTAAQELVALHYRNARGPGKPDAFSGFGVDMVFHLSARQRRDVDNMVKLVLDALTGWAWRDDSQVTEIAARIRYDSDDARTTVRVRTTPDLPEWMHSTCRECGNRFRTYPSWQSKIYCGQACRSAALLRKRTRPCEHCGRDYAGTAKQKFCSTECAHLGATFEATCAHCDRTWRRPVSTRRSGRQFCDVACRRAYWHDRPPKTPVGTCQCCGAPVSRREYQRCNSCKLANVPIPVAP